MGARGMLLAVLIGALIGIWNIEPAQAQLGGLKKKAEEKAKKEAEKKAQKAIEGKEEAPAEESTSQQGESAKGEAAAAGAAAEKQEPGAGVWVNYDFVPGSRVIFFDDFSKDVVGNFPQRLEFVEGNMEVAEWKGQRWLRASSDSRFQVPLPEVLPDKFTIEFDMYAPYSWNETNLCGSARDNWDNAEVTRAQTGFCVNPWDRTAGLFHNDSKGYIASLRLPDETFDGIYHCRILADGKYMKAYINQTRVANVPKTAFTRTNALWFDTYAQTEKPSMYTNFRIAVSDKTIYDALSADGRVATHGILFDSGSDKIRPESTPTLKEIGQMLTDHPELNLMIEGHTDNVGDDASNQTLSENRAAAVKGYLIEHHKIDAARLQSQGFGETKPVAGNDTPEGRQNNRRVELVKL
jgi:outer membrane protein OmpA-like peptidoglycan-associated protein